MILFLGVNFLCAAGTRTSEDYAVAGRRASVAGVMGILLGTLIGGSSTMGTAQMAYHYGLSACGFTFGGGVACFLLGRFFVKPLRRLSITTLPQFIEEHYDRKTSLLCVLALVAGSLLSATAQFVAGAALLRTAFPLSRLQSLYVTAFLVLFFIYFGGARSLSVVGSGKLVLLVFVLLVCAADAAADGYTPARLWRDLPFDPWFNPAGQGFFRDANAFLSVICGVLPTQIYIQAILSAPDDATAGKACFLSALLAPVIGVLGLWTGLSMRLFSPVLQDSSQALPFFIRTRFPPFAGGVLWAGILLVVVITLVGLSLGISTNIARDICLRLPAVFGKVDDDRKLLSISRFSILLVILTSLGASSMAEGQMILRWGYLGMGVKGACVLVPLVLAVLKPGTLEAKWGFLSSVAGFFTCLVCFFLFPEFAFLAGISAAALPAAAGTLLKGSRRISKR